VTFRDELSVTRSQVEPIASPSSPLDEALQVRRVPLGGSAFSHALQQGTVGRAWYAPRPATAASWLSHMVSVRENMQQVDWLTALAPAFAVTGAAAERLAQAAARGVVVTTGQQPGLFGGPTYTWTKAIGALAFADQLERDTGVPVAPVFWAASDDADWAEAAVTHVATARGLLTASLTGPASDGVAMSDVVLGRLDEARAALALACGSAAHSSVLDIVDAAYVPHATIGAAYVQLLRAMLEPLGIAVLDASHPTLRTVADSFLRHALKHASGVHDALRTRVQEIEQTGYSPQVDVVDGLSLVFRTQTVDRDGEVRRFRERVPLADAAGVAREAEPGTLGANVLLRPVLERHLLPTVSYLAGPGEYTYFAQVEPVARALGAATPVVAPRFACEVVETEMLARMERLGLSESDLRDPHAAERVVARSQLEETVADSMERLRLALETQVRAIRETMAGDDAPVADEVVDGLARDLTHRIDRFERRVVAGVKRLEHESMRDVAAIRAALRPAGQSPERMLNLVPLLARYGTGLFERMRDAAIPHARALVSGPLDPA
jgi:bacillithiol biosynthesis cysteine-adding enzyme BshC